MNLKLFYIKWHDAKGCHADWQHLEDLENVHLKDYHVESIGWMLRETETVIHITPHIHIDGEEGHYCGDMQIPKAMIVEMSEII